MKRNKRYVEQIVIKSSIFLFTDENYYARVDISSVLLSFTKAFPYTSLFPSLYTRRKRANVHQNVKMYWAPLENLTRLCLQCFLFVFCLFQPMQTAQEEVDLNMKCRSQNLGRSSSGALY